MTAVKFCDVRIIGSVKSIRGSDVVVASQLRDGTVIDYTVSVTGPEIFAVAGDIVMVLGELSGSGDILVSREYGEFVVVGEGSADKASAMAAAPVKAATPQTRPAQATAPKPVARPVTPSARPAVRPVPAGLPHAAASNDAAPGSAPRPGAPRFGGGIRRSGMAKQAGTPASPAPASQPNAAPKPSSSPLGRRRGGFSSSQDEDPQQGGGADTGSAPTTNTRAPSKSNTATPTSAVKRPRAVSDNIDDEVPF